MPLGAISSHLTSAARMRRHSTTNDGRASGMPSHAASKTVVAVAYAVDLAREERSNGVAALNGSKSGAGGLSPPAV
jgi:hypothetical protein